MKKIVLTMFLCLIASISYATVTPISVDTFVSPDDVSIPHLEDFRTTVVDSINSFNGGRIQTDTVTPDALNDNADPTIRWGEAFGEWVYEGLVPPTTAGLTSTTTLGTAYVKNNANELERVVKDATGHTYSASKYTYVDLKHDGTYTYVETAIGAGEPSVTAESIRLARVSTDASDVVNVRDDRIMSISLDSAQEDFYRTGLRMTVFTPDVISIDCGIIYNGSYRVRKVTPTSLNLTTAGDWVSGGSEQATSKYGFVVVGPETNGAIKLTTTAPTKHDRQGNSGGIIRYSVIGSDYWRCIGWFRMNASGSGELTYHDWGNFADGQNIENKTIVTGDTNVSTTLTTFADLDNMSTYFYNCTSGDVNIQFNARFFQSVDDADQHIAINIDGKIYDQQGLHMQNDAGHSVNSNVSLLWTEDLPMGGHLIKIQWNTSVGTLYQYGDVTDVYEGEGIRKMIVEEKI